LIYLPLAMAVCILAENIPTLDQKTIAVLSWATGIYLIVLIATFFFDNENDIFMPVIFLIGSIMAIWLIHLNKLTHPYRWLLAITMLNAGVNAIYAAFPYNGDFSSSMLSRGEYQTNTSNHYGNLDQDLKNNSFYRVSTISQNKIIDGPNLDNDLTSGLHNIDSYYSLQNKYLGQFNTSLQNNQYQANIPIRQADDRSIMNNFFGVKYLFVQSNGKNATKIPAGYFMDKATDPVINYDSGQPNPRAIQKGKEPFVPTQTIRYQSKQAFPLLYWQGDYISAKRYRRLSPTAKERALAAGVLVDGSTKGMGPANLHNQVYTLRSVQVSNRLNQVNPHQLKYTDSDENYQLQFPELENKKFAKRFKQTELHIEFSKIK